VTVELIRSATLSTRSEYAYAAVIDPSSTLIFTAGACPLDADGATVGRGKPAVQARQVMLNLVEALRECGATLSDVVKSTIYVASPDRGDLGLVWNVVREFFGDHDAPSTLLGVSVLGWDDQLVEVEAVAVCPQQNS
jgi:enamine deaminase RidA (YjgF/YER057c/UK114 family)